MGVVGVAAFPRGKGKQNHITSLQALDMRPACLAAVYPATLSNADPEVSVFCLARDRPSVTSSRSQG